MIAGSHRTGWPEFVLVRANNYSFHVSFCRLISVEYAHDDDDDGGE